MSRYSANPADLATLHTLCRTAHHRLAALQATILSSAACGLGITSSSEVGLNKSIRLWKLNILCKLID